MYSQIGNVIDVFANGIIKSVPICITFVKYTVNTVAIIRSPNILYLGFKPSVLFNINFLKSSTNPTSPNPTVTKINGIKFLAIACSDASMDFEYLKNTIAPIMIMAKIITIPPIVGVPCFFR